MAYDDPDEEDGNKKDENTDTSSALVLSTH